MRVEGGCALELLEVVGEALSVFTCGINCTLGLRPSPVVGWRVGRRHAGTKEALEVDWLAVRSGRIEGATGRERGEGGAGEEPGEGEAGMAVRGLLYEVANSVRMPMWMW